MVNATGNGDSVLTNIIYGPVPSRRLGRSLGVNNIPPKICSYSCVYCQLGRTKDIRINRENFYDSSSIYTQVTDKATQVEQQKEAIDYIAFVPDGEPTLDINIGKSIELLQKTGLKVAVITNASLIFRQDVRDDLQKADWVSLKVDAVTPRIWQQINRPHQNLDLAAIMEGILDFTKAFKGKLTTETMLVKGINDDTDEIEKITVFLSEVKPSIAYLSVPTRPPAERIEPATEQILNTAYQIFNKNLINVEYLIDYEGNAFSSTGTATDDLLSITAVHPMREDAVRELLGRHNQGWDIVRDLINNGRLAQLEYNGRKFYARKMPIETSFSGSSS